MSLVFLLNEETRRNLIGWICRPFVSERKNRSMRTSFLLFRIYYCGHLPLLRCSFVEKLRCSRMKGIRSHVSFIIVRACCYVYSCCFNLNIYKRQSSVRNLRKSKNFPVHAVTGKKSIDTQTFRLTRENGLNKLFISKIVQKDDAIGFSHFSCRL